MEENQVTNVLQTGLQVIYSVVFLWIVGKSTTVMLRYWKWRKLLNDCPGETEFSWLTGNTHKVYMP